MHANDGTTMDAGNVHLTKHRSVGKPLEAIKGSTVDMAEGDEEDEEEEEEKADDPEDGGKE